MSVIAESLSNVVVGAPQSKANLAMFPLLGDGPAEPGYLLLDDALQHGCLNITEISESGSVPELSVVNDCDLPVLLLDGEELVGAKQNRMLNLSVLAAAKQSTIIPVSCVEAGRWHHQSADFKSAGRAHFAAARAQKAEQVSASLRSSGRAQANQSAVWDEIAEKSARMDAFSETAAAEALYERHRVTLDDFRGAFAATGRQVGVLFALNGEVVGLDLFDSPKTLAGLLPKLIESNALDAIDASGHAETAVAPGAAETFLKQIAQAKADQFPAVGEGLDMRLDGERVAGGALVKGSTLIHLCAFRSAARGSAGSSRLVRASRRGRARRLH